MNKLDQIRVVKVNKSNKCSKVKTTARGNLVSRFLTVLYSYLVNHNEFHISSRCRRSRKSPGNPSLLSRNSRITTTTFSLSISSHMMVRKQETVSSTSENNNLTHTRTSHNKTCRVSKAKGRECKE